MQKRSRGFFMFSLLLAEETTTYPEWMTSSFPIIRVVIMSLALALAIAITLIVMFMDSDPEGGMNAITGQSDSFYSKNKGSSKQGRLKRAVIICSITLAVLIIAFWILWRIMPANQ